MEKAGPVTNGTTSSIDAVENSVELDPLQRQIVALAVGGYSTRESARMLGIKVPAAERCLSQVCDKLRVSNTLELVLFALHHQLVENDHTSLERT
jgi:DNA-binding CsgD family transcriptional regulator